MCDGYLSLSRYASTVGFVRVSVYASTARVFKHFKLCKPIMVRNFQGMRQGM